MINHRFNNLVATVCLLLSVRVFAIQNEKCNFNKWLMMQMKSYNISAVSIAVIHHYKINWAKGYGVKNKFTMHSVTTQSLFEAESISKPITAMAALKAIQLKKISLNTNINDYLKSWKLPSNKFTRNNPVSLEMLLNHSGGVSVHGFLGCAKGHKLPTLRQVLNGQPPANNKPIRVISNPGKKFNYSGGGYTIIQQALIDSYHQSFPELMKHLLFNPLKMTHSTFQQPLPKGLQKYAVTPYRDNGKAVKGGPHTYVALAAAGLWTTPIDIAKFTIGLQYSLGGKKNAILNQHYAKLMVKPSITNNMALGFETNINKFGKAVKHGNYFKHPGEDEGYQSL